MLQLLSVLVVLLVSPVILFAQNQEKIWQPFGKAAWLTSSFSESRGTRYHAGFDYSTEKETGWPIFAPENGQVERVRISPFGYGKALYFQGESGKTWLFAHLSGFADGVQKKTDAYRFQHYSNDLDWKLTVSFDKGDTLAFSGQTGIGEAHLHLEVRTDRSTVIDPAKAGVDLSDTLPPEILHAALWNGSNMESFQSTRSDKGVFNIGTTSYKKARLAIKIRDYSRLPADNPMSIRSLDVFCGRIPVFHKRYDTQRYGGMQVILRDLLWAEEAGEAGDWHQIAPQPGHKNSRFFNKMHKCLDRNATENFRVVAVDFAGNRSEKIFRVNRSPRKLNTPSLNEISHLHLQEPGLFSFLSNTFISKKSNSSLWLDSVKVASNTRQKKWLEATSWDAYPLRALYPKLKSGRLYSLRQKNPPAIYRILELRRDSSNFWTSPNFTIRLPMSREPTTLVLRERTWTDSILGTLTGLEIHPKGLVVEGKMEVCLPKKDLPGEGLFYRSSGSGNWNSFSRTLKDGNMICTRIKAPRDIALGIDNEAPTLLGTRTDTLNLGGKLQAARFVALRDRGVGIGDADKLQTRCEANWVPNEYDLEEGGTWILEKFCPSNKNILVEAEDDFGNTARWTIDKNTPDFPKKDNKP